MQVVRNGMTMHVNEAKRHGQKTPRKQIMNVPMVTKTPAAASKMPRIDGSLKAQDGSHFQRKLTIDLDFFGFLGEKFHFPSGGD